MKVLTKYLVSEFAKLLLVFEGVFIFLYLAVDVLQKIDNFIEASTSESLILTYFLYKIPFVAVQMFPPAIAVAIVVMFSGMRKSQEITAMKSCGINLFSIAQVLVVTSVFVGLISFLISETLVPFASTRSNLIWRKDVQKQDPGLFYGSSQIWYKGAEWIYWIRSYDSRNQIMENPILYFFDQSFRLTKKIEGRSGIWENGSWRVEDAVVQVLAEDGTYRVEKRESLILDIPETPESFVKGLKKPEEMGYWQLKRYAEEVRKEGYDNSRYLVDMNIKIALPFICLVLVLMGIPIALRIRRGGAPLAVSLGIAGCFLYVLVLGLSRSLGLMGVLPPLLAAWVSNLLFSFLGIYLMMHVER